MKSILHPSYKCASILEVQAAYIVLYTIYYIWIYKNESIFNFYLPTEKNQNSLLRTYLFMEIMENIISRVCRNPDTASELPPDGQRGERREAGETG
jgi:hypothetical protein